MNDEGATMALVKVRTMSDSLSPHGQVELVHALVNEPPFVNEFNYDHVP